MRKVKHSVLSALNSLCVRGYSTLIEKRSPLYGILRDVDTSFFERLLGSAHCVKDTNSLEAFNTDWLRMCRGSSRLALLPANTAELSAILKYCNENNLAVCPQGGNTGLVGGSVPVYDEIVVSTRRMNNILQTDTQANIISCQSGCVLQNLDEHLAAFDLIMPLDLAAKGSCHIGGNVSTCAGGLRLLRYGSLRGNVLGLEVVQADGTVLDLMNAPVRKDNTGYDLKQLFIGAEGTLGFISGVSILCPVRPRATNAIFVACSGSSFDQVVRVFQKAKTHLNEILSAFEFMDRESMLAVNHSLQIANPFQDASVADKCQFYCLVETHGSCEQHDRDKIEQFFSSVVSSKLCLDAIIAQNDAQFAHIWSVRERVSEAMTKTGYNFKYDISLPIGRIYDLVNAVRHRLSAHKSIYNKCIGYGHVGDGNLHLNVSSREYDERLFNLLEPFVFEWTRENSGSISAEHGLGLKKRDYIYYTKPRKAVKEMQRIKSLFDPKHILNPYKTIPRIE